MFRDLGERSRRWGTAGAGGGSRTWPCQATGVGNWDLWVRAQLGSSSYVCDAV